MKTSPRELASRFGYPSELTLVLEELLAAVEAARPRRCSFVLSGSVATGDFISRRDSTGVRFLSDIDATLYVEGELPGRDGLEACIALLEKRYDSPLFHIDLSIDSYASIERMGNRFQHVEAGMAGIVLLGEDVTPRFPRSVDAGSARLSTIGNLWKCLLNWSPPEVDEVDGGDEAYRIALSRSILDLPILALSEEGRCLPGHRARAEAFIDREDAPPLVTESTRRSVALASRMRETGDVTRAELERSAIECVASALEFLGLDRSEIFEASPSVVRSIAAFVPGRSVRRFLGESRGIRRSGQSLGSGIQWWLRRKEPAGAAALLALFAYAAGGAVGDPRPGIVARLNEFAGGRIDAGSGVPFVMAARRRYWEGRCRLNPSDQAKSAFYDRALADQKAAVAGN